MDCPTLASLHSIEWSVYCARVHLDPINGPIQAGRPRSMSELPVREMMSIHQMDNYNNLQNLDCASLLCCITEICNSMNEDAFSSHSEESCRIRNRGHGRRLQMDDNVIIVADICNNRNWSICLETPRQLKNVTDLRFVGLRLQVKGLQFHVRPLA